MTLKRDFKSLPSALLAAAFACMVLVACAQPTDTACVPVVRDAWIRMPPMRMPMLAGFARIDNACEKPVVVVGVSSPAFGSVELHETTIVDGISRMRAVPALQIDARGARQMESGGLHLMLKQPQTMPQIGEKLRVDFNLADGRTVHGEFEVRPADAR